MQKPLGPVDLSLLRDLSAGDTAFMKELIDTILYSVPKELLLLAQKIEEGNFKEQTNTLHKLKPSIDYFGIPSLIFERKDLYENAINGVDIKNDYFKFKAKVDIALKDMEEQQQAL